VAGPKGNQHALKMGPSKVATIEQSYYLRLGLAVARQNHISLREAMGLTLVQAWGAVGAEIRA
jgi:hypothetical protein